MPSDAELYTMKELMGYSVKEISEIYKQSPRGISTRIHRYRTATAKPKRRRKSKSES